MAYFAPITLLLILQWHTGVCEETFDVNSKIAQTTQSLKLHCQKVDSTRNGKLRRLSGRFQTLIWRPGETVKLCLPQECRDESEIYIYQRIQLLYNKAGSRDQFSRYQCGFRLHGRKYSTRSAITFLIDFIRRNMDVGLLTGNLLSNLFSREVFVQSSLLPPPYWKTRRPWGQGWTGLILRLQSDLSGVERC